MPTTFPGLGVTKARAILQQTDKIIQTFPEVRHVFGKIGRAETATDPAPMDMIETTIMLKPEEEWPAVDIRDADGKVIAHRRRTPDELTDAMNAAIQFPGLNNAWTMPIKTRIDMLATGIKTPVGIKIAGPDLAELERVASEVEAVVKAVPGTLSAFAERAMGGNYIEFNINRDAIARYGLRVGDVQECWRSRWAACRSPRRSRAWNATPSTCATTAISARTSARFARLSCPRLPAPRCP